MMIHSEVIVEHLNAAKWQIEDLMVKGHMLDEAIQTVKQSTKTPGFSQDERNYLFDLMDTLTLQDFSPDARRQIMHSHKLQMRSAANEGRSKTGRFLRRMIERLTW